MIMASECAWICDEVKASEVHTRTDTFYAIQLRLKRMIGLDSRQIRIDVACFSRLQQSAFVVSGRKYSCLASPASGDYT